MIRGVLLDVDDTLVDTRTAFAAGIADVVARWLPHLAPAEQEAALRHWVSDAEGHFRAYTRGEIDVVEQPSTRPSGLPGGRAPTRRGCSTRSTWPASRAAS